MVKSAQQDGAAQHDIFTRITVISEMKQKGITSFFSSLGPATKKARVDTAVASSTRVITSEYPPNAASKVSTAATPHPPASDVGTGETSTSSVFSSLNEEWKNALAPELKKTYIRTLEQFVDKEYSSHTVYPPKSDVFAALNACPLSEVKVVILGQDPYHGPGQVDIAWYDVLISLIILVVRLCRLTGFVFQYKKGFLHRQV